MSAPRIGYVGLGVMGGALARRLLREHKLTVFDLSPERCAEFAKLGATVVGSPARTIIYGSGYLRTKDYWTAGWKMTLASMALVLLMAEFYWPFLE